MLCQKETHHSPTNTNYLTGYLTAEHKRFFAFTVPDSVAASSAKLRIENPSNGYHSPDASEVLQIFDVTTPSTQISTAGKLTLNNTTVSGGCTFDTGGGGDEVSGGGIAAIGGALNNSAILDTAGQPDGGL